MTNAVFKCFKHMNDVSNNNTTRNANDLLPKKGLEVPVDWVGENKKRVPTQKFKPPIEFLF